MYLETLRFRLAWLKYSVEVVAHYKRKILQWKVVTLGMFTIVQFRKTVSVPGRSKGPGIGARFLVVV